MTTFLGCFSWTAFVGGRGKARIRGLARRLCACPLERDEQTAMGALEAAARLGRVSHQLATELLLAVRANNVI